MMYSKKYNKFQEGEKVKIKGFKQDKYRSYLEGKVGIVDTAPDFDIGNYYITLEDGTRHQIYYTLLEIVK